MAKPNEESMPDPMQSLMEELNIPLTRENYLACAYFGSPPAELGAEEEAELPKRFRSNYGEDDEDEVEANANADPVHIGHAATEKEIDWLELYLNSSGDRAERHCPCRRCGTQRWVQFCKTASEISANKLRAEGYIQKEVKPGEWQWVKTQ
jgi:hypothetical protein